MNEARAIVLFAHGSRDPAWRAPIEAVADRMRQIQPGSRVVCAYLELTEPDLPSTVNQLLTGGVRAITIWPMFLGTGRHAREDLPRLVEELRAQHPEAEFVLQAAIGEHPDVLESMARSALS
ncbi:MAG: CbiX/SirB N-terminal domain-containing protein [Comamonadaceae bacterium]|nr:CbiX/SirB N-terminal domain-containing protein [Comamonadaceae bacterium]